MSTPAKTYVVGASGYVGSAVAGRLARHGTAVEGTYHSRPLDGGVPFDFWSDDPSVLDDGDGVIFASLVERGDAPLDEFERRVERLTDACSGRRFVYLSSDAVFDGDSGRYAEDAPTDPSTAYGRRTVRFEDIVRRNCSNYCIVRPSYVYGFAGGVLDHRLRRTFRALRSGEQVTYFEDMFKSPIEVNQLAEVVRRLYRSDFCGTVHAGGPRVSVLEFHRRGASAFGADTDRIEPDEMPPDSPHPRDSSLDASLLAREFGLRPGGVVESLTARSVVDVLGA